MQTVELSLRILYRPRED